MRLRYRPKVTIIALMVLIAGVAFGVDWLRPLDHGKAARVAEARFRELPGASQWAGLFKVHAWRGSEEYWLVDFIRSDNGEHLAQIAVATSVRPGPVGADTVAIEAGPSLPDDGTP